MELLGFRQPVCGGLLDARAAAKHDAGDGAIAKSLAMSDDLLSSTIEST